MASVLLVHPMNDVWGFIPYALLYLESHLKANGHTVKIIDFQLGRDAHQAFVEALMTNPDVLGISLFLGPSVAMAKEAAAACRRISPNTKIVFGGILPSMYPDKILDDQNIDYIVRFEGEETFTQLVEALEHGINQPQLPGIGWMEDGKPVLQPRPPLMDLKQALPIEFDSAHNDRYILEGGYYLHCKRAGSFFTSRGCPYSCKFCYNHYYNAQRWRPFPTDWVLDGIEKLVRQSNIDGLYFLDDNFTVDKERARQILQGIRARGIELVYWWEMRIDQIIRTDDEELKEFYDLGCRCLYIGAESGSDRLLNSLDKGFTVDDIREANQKLAKIGIQPLYSMMIGLPGETKRETLQTADLALELLDSNPGASIWHINNYIPYPETPTYYETEPDRYSTAPNAGISYELGNITWEHSSNYMRRSISYASLFFKSEAFIDNMRFVNRSVFRILKIIFTFRVRYHIFLPFLDTLAITLIFQIQRSMSRGRRLGAIRSPYR